MLYARHIHFGYLEVSMDQKSFHDYLISLGVGEEKIANKINFISELEERLKKQVPAWTLEDVNCASAQSIVDSMIDRSENTLENLQTLLFYAEMIGNNDLFVLIFQHLDGYEVFDNLFNKLGNVVGEDLRDIIFEEMPLPPLGLSSIEKSLYTYRAMNRLEEIFEENTIRDLLKDSLRDLPESMYEINKRDYDIDCQKDIDCYLIKKGERFLETLRTYKHENKLFFGQEITDDVIAYVESNKEIGGGIRDGNIIYETKIPYNTKAYLSESDPETKRYYYCHCPWVRESVRTSALRVNPIFCQCSAGFHKKPYEIILGQALKAEVLKSVLKGDDICRFAIHLPELDSTKR